MYFNIYYENAKRCYKGEVVFYNLRYDLEL